jgi:hypothetical protein
MRINYWSCSKFADKIRGTKKIECGTADEWASWDRNAKNFNKFRFWVAEEALDGIQNFVNWPKDKIYAVKYYVVNRWVDETHALVAHKKHIKRGQYLDFDSRILICLFDELVDFVEIEMAYSYHRWDEEKIKKLSWWQGGMWRTRTWRSSEFGIKHLQWSMSLTNEDWLEDDKKHEAVPTSQAENAKEILHLYTWWTETYPNRPEAYDLSGWSAYCDDKRSRGVGFLETDPEENHEKTDMMLENINSIEKSYEDEDTEMLIRLIKIRRSLWT